LTLPAGTERSGQVLEARGVYGVSFTPVLILTLRQATAPLCRYDKLLLPRYRGGAMKLTPDQVFEGTTGIDVKKVIVTTITTTTRRLQLG
jgi:hypothetical protein